MHVRWPQRVGGHHGHQRGIDPSGQPDDDIGEAVLVHIVAGAEHQRGVHLRHRVERRRDGRGSGLLMGGRRVADRHHAEGPGRHPPSRVEQALAEHRPHIEVDHEHVLGEGSGASHELTIRVDDHRGAVEHQLVLTAHLVHVDQRARGVGGAGGQHPHPLRQAAGVVRRRVDVDDELGTSRRLLGDRATRTPCVLADAHPHAHTTDHEQLGFLHAGREVALLVEDGVVRQQTLVVDADHLTSRAHSRRVVQIEAGIDEADHRGAATGTGSHLLQRGAIVGDEPGLQYEVFGRVAGDGELGEGGQVGVGGLGPAERGRDPLDVPIEVADDGVDLAERHPKAGHAGSPRLGQRHERGVTASG